MFRVRGKRRFERRSHTLRQLRSRRDRSRRDMPVMKVGSAWRSGVHKRWKGRECVARAAGARRAGARAESVCLMGVGNAPAVG
eukprot:1510952-Prymnesium_polylepis.1